MASCSCATNRILRSTCTRPPTLAGKPTRLEIYNDGIYVSAGPTLYWSQLPITVGGVTSGSAPSFTQITLDSLMASGTIGGISFDGGASAAKVYVPFQAGTGGAYGGSVCTYGVTQSSPASAPEFLDGTTFVTSGPSTFSDTPEFVLHLPD